MILSPEISTQTFLDGKVLKMNSLVSTAAISAAVASLLAWHLTHYSGDISSQDINLSACPYTCCILPLIQEVAMRPKTSDCS